MEAPNYDSVTHEEMKYHLEKLSARITERVSRDEFEALKKQVGVNNQVINLLVGMVNFLRSEIEGIKKELSNGKLDSESDQTSWCAQKEIRGKEGRKNLRC